MAPFAEDVSQELVTIFSGDNLIPTSTVIGPLLWYGLIVSALLHFINDKPVTFWTFWVTFFVNFVLIYALSGRSPLVNGASAQNAVELCFAVENRANNKAIVRKGVTEWLWEFVCQYIQPKAVGECSSLHDSLFTFYCIK